MSFVGSVILLIERRQDLGGLIKVGASAALAAQATDLTDNTDTLGIGEMVAVDFLIECETLQRRPASRRSRSTTTASASRRELNTDPTKHTRT